MCSSPIFFFTHETPEVVRHCLLFLCPQPSQSPSIPPESISPLNSHSSVLSLVLALPGPASRSRPECACVCIRLCICACLCACACFAATRGSATPAWPSLFSSLRHRIASIASLDLFTQSHRRCCRNSHMTTVFRSVHSLSLFYECRNYDIKGVY
jgi:hypothetical protein